MIEKIKVLQFNFHYFHLFLFKYSVAPHIFVMFRQKCVNTLPGACGISKASGASGQLGPK